VIKILRKYNLRERGSTLQGRTNKFITVILFTRINLINSIIRYFSSFFLGAYLMKNIKYFLYV